MNTEIFNALNVMRVLGALALILPLWLIKRNIEHIFNIGNYAWKSYVEGGRSFGDYYVKASRIRVILSLLFIVVGFLYYPVTGYSFDFDSATNLLYYMVSILLGSAFASAILAGLNWTQF